MAQDGQRFDENFARGLAGSTVFAPVLSARCLKSFVELGHQDKEDFVLMEFMMAIELQRRGIVKAIFPILVGEQSRDGKFSQSFFEELRNGSVSWPAASDGSQSTACMRPGHASWAGEREGATPPAASTAASSGPPETQAVERTPPS